MRFWKFIVGDWCYPKANNSWNPQSLKLGRNWWLLFRQIDSGKVINYNMHIFKLLVNNLFQKVSSLHWIKGICLNFHFLYVLTWELENIRGQFFKQLGPVLKIGPVSFLCCILFGLSNTNLLLISFISKLTNRINFLSYL